MAAPDASTAPSSAATAGPRARIVEIIAPLPSNSTPPTPSRLRVQIELTPPRLSNVPPGKNPKGEGVVGVDKRGGVPVHERQTTFQSGAILGVGREDQPGFSSGISEDKGRFSDDTQKEDGCPRCRYTRLCSRSDLVALEQHAKKALRKAKRIEKRKMPPGLSFPKKILIGLRSMDAETSKRRKKIERFIETALQELPHEQARRWANGHRLGGIVESVDRDLKSNSRELWKHAHDLGQFFTLESNAKTLVRWSLGLLSKEDGDDKRPWCYLEPSAGTGSIFNVLPANSPKLGFEIDPELAHRHGFRLGDFLQSTRNCIIPPLPGPESHRLCAIGNPPYSAFACKDNLQTLLRLGEVRNNNSCRCFWRAQEVGSDIPALFIVHSLCCLQAEAVAMILPKRCSKCSSPESKEHGFVFRVYRLYETIMREEGKHQPTSNVARSNCGDRTIKDTSNATKKNCGEDSCIYKGQLFAPRDFSELPSLRVHQKETTEHKFEFAGVIVRKPVVFQLWLRHASRPKLSNLEK